VIQDDALTASGTPMVVVLPLTTQVYPSFKRWRIMIEPRDRLLKPCQVVVDQPRALDKDRFGDGPLTSLTMEEMAAVEHSLKAVMGLL
jgi:mRNA interferase MazF